MSTPEEITPDGALWVDIHAISHTHRGNGNRGKRLRDRWQLLYTLHNPDGTTREAGRDIYSEDLDKFDHCGLNFEWPHNSRIELVTPIPVVFDEEYKLVQVGQVEH